MSKLYQGLFEAYPDDTYVIKKKWEVDLREDIEMEEWLQNRSNVQTESCN